MPNPFETQDSHLLAEAQSLGPQRQHGPLKLTETQDSHLLAEAQSLGPQRQHPR